MTARRVALAAAVSVAAAVAWTAYGWMHLPPEPADMDATIDDINGAGRWLMTPAEHDAYMAANPAMAARVRAEGERIAAEYRGRLADD